MNRNLTIAGGIIVAAVVMYYIHSTTNRYYVSTSSGGAAYRIDKQTGQTWLLRGVTMSEVKQPGPAKPPVPLRSLPIEERRKVTGNAGLSFGALFQGKLYNGSTWCAREVVITITAKEADGTTRWTRQFKGEVFIASLTTGTFQISVTEAEGATLQWTMDDVRGCLQSEHDGE